MNYFTKFTKTHDADFTCLSKGSEGHSLLVFAVRQQRYGDVTADPLQLAGTLDGLADGCKHPPHPPPVLQLGAKLWERKNDKVKAGTSHLKQKGPESQPRFPPQRGPHPGVPDRGQRRLLFDDRQNQSVTGLLALAIVGAEPTPLTCQN